jgi:hypothetical protein
MNDTAEQEAPTTSIPNQEEIPTPPRIPIPPPSVGTEPIERRRPSGILGFLVGLALLLSLASLVLNILMIYGLLNVREAAIGGLDTALDALLNLGDQGFQYEYQFEQTIPVSANIPISQTMIFPFKGNFPINTTVQVPIDAGVLGSFVIDVPINTSVYVETEVPIQIDQNFEVSTTIPVSMTIPIDIQADDPAIQEIVSGVRQWLTELRQTFDINILPGLFRSE